MVLDLAAAALRNAFTTTQPSNQPSGG